MAGTTEPKIVNGLEVKSFEQMLAEARETYTNAISDALDEALARFVLPSDRVMLLQDAAQFLCFMTALKLAEVTTPAGAPFDKKDPLRAWWKLGKTIDKEVPAMLLEYGREVAARQAEGANHAG